MNPKWPPFPTSYGYIDSFSGGYSLGKIIGRACVSKRSICGFDCIIFLFGAMSELADVSENGILHCTKLKVA